MPETQDKTPRLGRRAFLAAGITAAGGAALWAVNSKIDSLFAPNNSVSELGQNTTERIDVDKDKARQYASMAIILSGGLSNIGSSRVQELILSNAMDDVEVNGFKGAPIQISVPGAEGYRWWQIKGPAIHNGVNVPNALGDFSVIFGFNEEGEARWLKAAVDRDKSELLINGYNALLAPMKVIADRQGQTLEETFYGVPQLTTIKAGRNVFDAYIMPHFNQTLDFMRSTHLVDASELALLYTEGIQTVVEVYLKYGLFKQDVNLRNFAHVQLRSGDFATLPIDWEGYKLRLDPKINPSVAVQWLVTAAEVAAKKHDIIWPGWTLQDLLPAASFPALPIPTTPGALAEIKTTEGVNALVSVNPLNQAANSIDDIVEGAYRVLPPTVGDVYRGLGSGVIGEVGPGLQIMFLWSLGRELSPENWESLELNGAVYGDRARFVGTNGDLSVDDLWSVAVERKRKFASEPRMTDGELNSLRRDWNIANKYGLLTPNDGEDFLRVTKDDLLKISLAGSLNLKFDGSPSDTFMVVLGEDLDFNDDNKQATEGSQLLFWKKASDGKPMMVALATLSSGNWDILPFGQIIVSVPEAKVQTGASNPIYNLVGDRNNPNLVLIERADTGN